MDPSHRKMLDSHEFRHLVGRRWRVSLILTALLFLLYYGYIILIATNKALLSQKLGDVVTLGIPMGAVILKEHVAQAIKAGDHGTTFGGGPLACRTSLEYFKVIEDDKLLDHIRETGAYFKSRLEELKDLPVVKEVRGIGLMLAVELNVPGKDYVKHMLDRGFIINCTHETALRFLPPFIITSKQVDKMVRALRDVLAT